MFDKGLVNRRMLYKGDTLFSEGEPGDAAYVVESGSVGIYKTIDQGVLHLATLRKGELFGEMAIIDGSARMASAVALQDAVVVKLPRASIEGKLDKYDPFIRMLVRILVQNLRNVHRAYMRRPRSIRDYVNVMNAQAAGLRGYVRQVAEADPDAELLKRLDTFDEALSGLVELFARRVDRRRSVLTEADLWPPAPADDPQAP